MEDTVLNTFAPHEPDEAAERTARHARICAEMIDLSMDLARAAFKKARADLSQTGTATDLSGRKASEAALLFVQLFRAMRDCVALEARLAPGPVARNRAPAAQPIAASKPATLH